MKHIIKSNTGDLTWSLKIEDGEILLMAEDNYQEWGVLAITEDGYLELYEGNEESPLKTDSNGRIKEEK